MPWAVRAPALLVIGVIGSVALDGAGPLMPSSSPSASSSAPLQLSYQVLRSELQRRPSADLLTDSPGGVADLCTVVELVLERLAVRGDWQAFVTLLAALLAALGGALIDLCSAAAAAATAHAGPSRQRQSGDARPPLALAVAAMQETAAAALAALHASCRQIGAACARAAAAAGNNNAPSAAAPGGARTAAGKAEPGPAASRALAAVAGSVHAAAAAAAGPGGPAPGPAGLGRSWALPASDQWVALSVAAAAAGGLIEGCALTVRLQPLGRPQEVLLRLLQPALEPLSGALREAAAAASAASSAATLAEAAPLGNGGGWSACCLDADPQVVLLDAAVGYVWSRLRAQAPLPGPLQPALRAADQMTAAATAATAAVASAGTAAASVASGGGLCWHPARGALAVLMLGSLGVGRVLQMAATGGSADIAAELLDEHSRGALFADTQLLAKAVVESLRAAPPGAAAASIGSAASMGTALALICDAAAAARRLHLLYGEVADSAEGRAWLAALPSTATGAMRELLNRAFVCEVSVLAVAYDMLSSTPPAPGSALAPGGPLAGAGAATAASGAEARAPAAAAALGALADLQFCALQLRAHGDLVARLSADAMAAPAAALPPLLALLPCYPVFAAGYGGGFAAVPVAASHLAFLLPLVSSCVPHAADVGTATSAVLPYMYLLMKGAPESVVQAAHSMWGALLAGLCGAAAGAGPAGSDGGAGGGGAGRAQAASKAQCSDGVRVAVAASMVPYYLDRACGEACSAGDLELLEWGVRQVLQSLPEAHLMKAWCVTRLVRQLAGWAAACEELGAAAATLQALDATGRQPLGAALAQGETVTDAVVLVRRCATVVGLAVSLLDFPLLPSALQALDAALPLVPRNGARILQQLHDVWLSSNDYARKQLLDGWLQRSLVKFHVSARL